MPALSGLFLICRGIPHILLFHHRQKISASNNQKSTMQSDRLITRVKSSPLR
nr:MAG TPA_asm: hypothetical protein [Bacteriophage sp.]